MRGVPDPDDGADLEPKPAAPANHRVDAEHPEHQLGPGQADVLVAAAVPSAGVGTTRGRHAAAGASTPW